VAEGSGRRAFIGRGVELARLRDALAATLATGGGRTVVIGGEAGIGKSRLVERFAEDAPERVRVLVGACLEVAEDALPYAPFVEVLRTVVRTTPEARLPALLGPGRGELTRLLPELALRAADVPAKREADRASQARLFELVLGLLERLAAERALVLVIEDVQWADRSTRDLVGFLSRALRDDPVLLVLTTRTDAVGEAVGNLAFLAELEREEHVDRLQVAPFQRDEVADLAAELLADEPSPALVDRLVARTDGNPFYVEELVHAVGADGAGAALPPVLRDVLAARVAGLSKGAREILRAAAAAGRRIDDALLASVLGLSPRELASGLREALESGILTRVEAPAGQVSEFRHALLQEVAAEELFPAELAALHAAFAEALERRLAAGDRSVIAVALARHWDAAGDGERALPYLVQAAAGAEAVYAFAEARRLWERAADLLETASTDEVLGRDLPEALARAGDCAVLVGEPRRAAQLIQRALIHLYPRGEQQRVLQYENRLRWHLWWSGDRAATVAAIAEALEAVPPQELRARARILAQQAAVRMLAGDFESSAAAAREAIELAAQSGSDIEVALAHGVLGWDLAMLGDVDAGIAEYQKGQALAEAAGSVEGMALAASNLAALLDRVGRSEASLEVARAGYEKTERFGVARTYGAGLLGYAAKALLALGRWNEADAITGLGLRRGAVDASAVWLSVNRARLLVGRGRFEEAAELLQRARATETRLGGTDHATALLAAEAELAVWSGDIDEALRVAETAMRSARPDGPPDPSLAWIAALVLRAIADGGPAARERGSPLARQIEAAVAAAASRPGFSTGDRALALLTLLRAEGTRVAGRSAATDWAETAERWGALARPFQAGYARYREGEAILAARGDRARAAEALLEAAGIATRLGAAPLGGLVATLAAQARIALPQGVGGTPASPAAGIRRSVDELTTREAEVLRLVAAGWTNQQIADALFITRKTASVHVSNIMGKLGAANRGEAAALAHRLGLASDAPIPSPMAAVPRQ
jgi:DNA-binding CsgD family transcriptional regulator/tetratricopeptide (TPR) repeat protein